MEFAQALQRRVDLEAIIATKPTAIAAVLAARDESFAWSNPDAARMRREAEQAKSLALTTALSRAEERIQQIIACEADLAKLRGTYGELLGE